MTVKGAIRALPIGVNLYYYGLNKELALEEGITDPADLTWGKLLDIALDWKERGEKGRALFGGGFSSKDLLGHMLTNNRKDLINEEEKTCDLRQEWFLELMRKWKEVDNAGYLYCYGDTELLYRERNGEDTIFINGFDKGSLLQAYNRRWLQNDWRFKELDVETEQFWRYNDTWDCEQILLGGIHGEKSRNFQSVASMMFSVNARSEHKEEALRFLAFLMSEKVQTLYSVDGIPMNLEADRVKWERVSKNLYNESPYLNEEKVMEYYKLFSSVYEEIDQLFPDYYTNYIEGPMASYVMGALTLEEAVAKAEQDLWVHLNE